MTDLERLLPQLATKTDIAAVRQEIAACAKRADLERYATKADLESFATRADLETALERCATKEDLKDGLGELRTHMLVLHEAVMSEVRLAIELFGGRTDRHERRLDTRARTLEDHRRRIQRIEDSQKIPRE